LILEENWVYITAVIDGKRFEIDGINIWDYTWTDTRRYISIKDPIYHQPYTFAIYEIDTGTKKIEFAAGEFSNCVWGIYQKRS